ncbi:MAG: nucleotidyltransferase domain-containing protein [bacterium]
MQTELLQRIKERLQSLYGARFRGLVLYGSVARGNTNEDSDIDLLCLLEGPVSLWREIGTTVEAMHGLDLDGERYRVIEIIPVDVTDYEAGEFGFLQEVRREGVIL